MLPLASQFEYIQDETGRWRGRNGTGALPLYTRCIKCNKLHMYKLREFVLSEVCMLNWSVYDGQMVGLVALEVKLYVRFHRLQHT